MKNSLWTVIAQGVYCAVALSTVSVCNQAGITEVLAAENNAESRKSDTWQRVLDRRDFVAPEEKVVLFDSLRQLSDGRVQMLFDGKQGGAIDYFFNYKGKDVVTITGHTSSSFASRDGVLYFAQYRPNGTGCTALAFDLESGKTLWEVALHHQKPKGASGYSNVVAVRLSSTNEVPGGKAGAAVVIKGSESYCDYTEILDSATGESLAIKEYRVGF